MKHLKVLDEQSNENELVIEGYLALFGGEDLTGETFTKSTQFESDYTKMNSVLIDWEHGMQPDGKDSPTKNTILGKVDWESAKADEIGLHVRRILDRRKRYVKEIVEPLARAGMLASSSEAVPETVQKTADGIIQVWEVVRDSFTVTPAEPRLLTTHQMEVVKTLSDKYPAFKSLLNVGDGQETVTDNTLQGQKTGDIEMTEEEIKALVDKAVKAALEGQPDYTELVNQVGKKAAEEAVKAYLDSTPAPKKAGVVVVEDEADKAVKANPNKLGLFCKAVQFATTSPTRLENEHKAILGQNESVPDDGGYLVGTEQVQTLEKKMHDTAVFSSRVAGRSIGNGANSVDFYGVKENSRATGSRFGGVQGYRVAEGQTITASSMDFWKYTLKPEKYAAVCYATDEILNDTGLLQQEILESVPMELGFMLDDDILNGTAAGYPTGILGHNCLISVAKETGQAAATVVAQNIIKMWARMWSRSKANSVWFINQDVAPQLPAMNLSTGTGGQLVYMPPGGLTSAPFGTLYGRPIVETEFNATLGTVGDIVLADMSQYKLASKGTMQAATSMHVQFLTDQMAFRFTARYDGQPTWQSALTPYKGTNTVSPFVALATRS